MSTATIVPNISFSRLSIALLSCNDVLTIFEIEKKKRESIKRILQLYAQAKRSD